VIVAASTGNAEPVRPLRGPKQLHISEAHTLWGSRSRPGVVACGDQLQPVARHDRSRVATSHLPDLRSTSSRRTRAKAHTVEGPDRPRLWQRMVETFPVYAEYQERTTRLLPVVVLRRAG
jgi:hypothetical protein